MRQATVLVSERIQKVGVRAAREAITRESSHRSYQCVNIVSLLSCSYLTTNCRLAYTNCTDKSQVIERLVDCTRTYRARYLLNCGADASWAYCHGWAEPSDHIRECVADKPLSRLVSPRVDPAQFTGRECVGLLSTA